MRIPAVVWRSRHNRLEVVQRGSREQIKTAFKKPRGRNKMNNKSTVLLKITLKSSAALGLFLSTSHMSFAQGALKPMQQPLATPTELPNAPSQGAANEAI